MTERPDHLAHNANTSSSLTYFKSPLLTLMYSLQDGATDDIALYDVLDAYSTLLIRIRTVTPSIVTPSALRHPELVLISNSSAYLARCLQRDIRRVLDKPLRSTSQSGVVTTVFTNEPHEDAAHHATIVSMVCQHAIQVAAVVFRIPYLHSLFSDDHLSSLLQDLLAVVTSVELVGIDTEKTCSMAASIFSTLCIPDTVVKRKKDRILVWIRELVESMCAQTDNSKIIHHLLSTYPSLFLRETMQLLPEIFARVVASNPRDRMDVALALSGYASALASVWESVGPDTKQSFVAMIHEFIVAQLPNKPQASDPATASLLPDYLKQAISSDSSNGDGPRWAVTVVCCLIVLSGSTVFSGHRACRLVLQTAEQLRRKRGKVFEELHGCLWRCLIWAFSQLPPDDMVAVLVKQPEEKQHKRKRPENPRDVAFGIVRQEIRHGLGACLVATLLSSSLRRSSGAETYHRDIIQAVSVLKDMVSNLSDDIYNDGVLILARMLSSIGTSADTPSTSSQVKLWTFHGTVGKVLFSRRAMDLPIASFAHAIREANRFDAASIRRLHEDEIQQVWGPLLDIWVLCVRRELQRADFVTLKDTLLEAWQALLLVQTHLTQERGHLTATQETTDHAVSTVASFLDWPAPHGTTRAAVPDTRMQARVLSLCNQLWNVIRNVFCQWWLSQAAATLLARVTRHVFDVSSEDVKAAWGQLCAALVSASSPELITRLVSETDEERALELRRSLWVMTARAWFCMESQASLADSVSFLSKPFRHWIMSKEELAAWTAILEYAVTISGDALLVFDALVEDGKEEDSVRERLVVAPDIILLLLSRVNIGEELDSPSPFLQVVGASLCNLYSGSSENAAIALKIFEHTRHIIVEAPRNAILHVLSSLSDGLSIWIGDEAEHLSEEEHNEYVVPLYCDTLHALRDIPISSDTLHALAHFLYSAFVRIPHPGHGPIAFYEFWTHIQPSLAHLKGSYPEEIKTALQACHDAFGTELPEGLSIEAESQLASQLQVPHAASMVSEPPSTTSATPTKRTTRTRAEADSHMYAKRSLVSSPSALQGHARLPTTPKVTSPLSHSHHTLDSSPSSVRGSKNGPASPSEESHAALSSPADRLRAKSFVRAPMSRVSHERASRTPERPLKRRKLAEPSSPLASTSSSRGKGKDTGKIISSPFVPSARIPSPVKRRPHAREVSAAASGTSSAGGSRWVFDGVELPARRDHASASASAPVASPSPPTTPKASRTKTELVFSPEVPSPATAARSRPPSSDDYDAWEVPLCTDDMDLDSDSDVVPDSQPDGGDHSDDDDSLLPSFMKSLTGKGKGRAEDTTFQYSDETAPPAASSDVDDDDFDDYDEHAPRRAGGGRRPSPVRMRTAPASFQHDPAPQVGPARPAAPLRRARTGSVQLDDLQHVCDALQADGSQLGVDEMLAATALTHRLGALLSEKLSKKLGGPSGASGSEKKRGKRKDGER